LHRPQSNIIRNGEQVKIELNVKLIERLKSTFESCSPGELKTGKYQNIIKTLAKKADYRISHVLASDLLEVDPDLELDCKRLAKHTYPKKYIFQKK